ncbi:MAG TPA: arsenate reductase ArsC [Candidatus Udaeobacter sp.]|nr:arsenate reductase ArsC [Candidatus Udaeobacter sp.]
MFHRPRVLFICVHNGGRSQMCEAFLKHYGGDRFDAQSAGLDPGELNPLVVEAMAEIGIDISQNKTKSVFDVWKRGEAFQYVVAVCDAEWAEKCPIFPGVTKRLHWPFHDPSKITGTPDRKLLKVRQIRDEIAAKVQEWLVSVPVEQPA